MGRSRNPDYKLLFFGRCPGDVGLSEYGVRDMIRSFLQMLPSLIFILPCVERVGINTCMICAFFLIDYLHVRQPMAFFRFGFSDLIYPRCTEGSETDCGSTGWAFSLFIAWNLLSMVCAFRPWADLCLTESCFQYIFANMFTGTTVSSLYLVHLSTQICM